MAGYIITADLSAPMNGVVQSAGAFAVTGNSTPQVIAANGNISLVGSPLPGNPAGYVVVAPAAAVAGITMDIGFIDGQLVIVENNSAFSVTFAAAVTSHVADGVSDVIAANIGKLYIWNAALSLWFPV